MSTCQMADIGFDVQETLTNKRPLSNDLTSPPGATGETPDGEMAGEGLKIFSSSTIMRSLGQTAPCREDGPPDPGKSVQPRSASASAVAWCPLSCQRSMRAGVARQGRNVSVPSFLSTAVVGRGLNRLDMVVDARLLTPKCGRPCVGKLEHLLCSWLVRPCVRPVGAAHGAASRNAIRAARVPITCTHSKCLGVLGFPTRRSNRLVALASVGPFQPLQARLPVP